MAWWKKTNERVMVNEYWTYGCGYKAGEIDLTEGYVLGQGADGDDTCVRLKFHPRADPIPIRYLTFLDK